MAVSNQKRRFFLSTTRFQDAGVGLMALEGNYTPITASLPPYYENYYNNKNNRNEWSAGFHHFEPYFAPPSLRYTATIMYTFNIGDCLGREGGDHRDRYLE
jgi:hypothetical protein